MRFGKINDYLFFLLLSILVLVDQTLRISNLRFLEGLLESSDSLMLYIDKFEYTSLLSFFYG